MSKSTPSAAAHFPLDKDLARSAEPTLVTDDLFLAAYALSEGAKITSIEFATHANKQVASFRLQAADVRDLQRAYLTGTAVANVGALKRYLKHLKDLLFDQMRNQRQHRW